MWTNVSLNCHLVWETVLWTASAVWVEDQDAEPVAIHLSGQAPIGANDSPEAQLTVALGGFLAAAGPTSPERWDPSSLDGS